MSHAEWMGQASNDLAAAKLLSNAGHHSQAVWLAFQAVEKAHKAILVALGLQYEDKHFKSLGHNTQEIARLLPAALHHPIDLEIAVKISNLNSRAENCRYPSPPKGLPSAPVLAPLSRIASSNEDVANAELLLRWCQERVERALRASAAMQP